ncbi:MAG: GNAT family N-acetyltransferase [Eubacteriales bacterium]|nr:GNAT family N-acetyltransferase [Eubacteriales bacterium]
MVSDVQRLYENHMEEEVKNWIPNESYAGMEETRWAIKFYIRCVDKKVLPFVLAVESKETGELIGDIGINEVGGHSNEVEIGYSICRKYCGNGYATELVKEMTEFVRKKFAVNSLYGRVMRGNNASVRVLEKNGYFLLSEEFGAEDDPHCKGMLVYKKAF